MKKLNFLTAIISMIPTVVSAQYYYNQGYYGNTVPTGYNNSGYYASQVQGQQAQQAAPQVQPGGGTYYAPHTVAKKQPRDIGSIYVGADYVVGYASYSDTEFTVDSALTGGHEFVSDTGSFDRNLNSMSINLGFRPFRHLGIEAFYQQSLDENKVVYTESYTQYPEFARGEYEVSYKVMGVDLLGYLPINDYIELIASIGVGKYDATADVKVVAYEGQAPNGKLRSTDKSFEDSAMAYRIGGGMQIWLSRHLTFRLMARWTQIGGDFMDYITEVNAGVRYHF